MSAHPRLLAALARADFLERTRRYSTFVTLMSMIFMAWQSMPTRPEMFSMSVQLGSYRGVYNSAWVGGLLAMLVNTLLTLIGFYLVKNAVERDRLTGVGEILATTPLSRPAYTLGKTLSNFVFLAALPATLWLAGLGMQLLRGEDRHLDPLVMATPLVLSSLPALALVAALSVFFECVGWLRGTLGNVVFFFTWSGALATGITTKFDLLGVKALQASMGVACRATFPDYDANSLLIGGGGEPVRGTFVWHGFSPDGGFLGERLLILALAVGVALVAALPFDRFDPTRGSACGAAPTAGGRGRRRGAAAADAHGDSSAEAAGFTPAAGALPHVTLTPLAARPGGYRPWPLVRAELALLLKGVNRWWLLAWLGLSVAAFAVPGTGGNMVRGVAWLWPIGLWAGLGVRAARYRTEELLLSSPGPRLRQWPAALLAGVLVAAPAGAACVAHAGVAHGGGGVATAVAGWLFVPLFAFAAGRVSGSSRLFEIAYLLLWYIGPMNAVPLFDYTGGAPQLAGYGTAAGFLLAAAGAITLAALRPAARR